jgi:hypothetical protein
MQLIFKIYGCEMLEKEKKKETSTAKPESKIADPNAKTETVVTPPKSESIKSF